MRVARLESVLMQNRSLLLGMNDLTASWIAFEDEQEFWVSCTCGLFWVLLAVFYAELLGDCFGWDSVLLEL